MTAPPALLDYVTKLPGRCGGCGWHLATQGHAPDCTEYAATLDSVARDWRGDPDWTRFRDACRAAASESDDGRTVHVGVVRRKLTNEHGLTIQPRRLSAFWHRAQSRDGFLISVGWEKNDDTAGRNQGKPIRVYRMRVA